MIFKKNKSKVEAENTSRVSKNRVKIRVYMRFGSEIRQKRAEYWAVEKRDGYNNLVAVSENEKIGHNEDVDFTQENVYSAMKVTLGISGKSKEEVIKIVETNIKKHEKRVKAIDSHPELNKYANIWDEKRKLREFEIYKKYVKYVSGNGAYFKLEDGVRVYEYESIGGFLIPIWHGADSLVDYSDFTNKKKITMQETGNLDKILEGKGVKKLMVNALVMILLINVVLFGILMYSGFKVYNKSNELDQQVFDVAGRCAAETAKNAIIYTEIMRNPFVKEEIKKIQADKNNSMNERIRDLTPLS